MVTGKCEGANRGSWKEAEFREQYCNVRGEHIPKKVGGKVQGVSAQEVRESWEMDRCSQNGTIKPEQRSQRRGRKSKSDEGAVGRGRVKGNRERGGPTTLRNKEGWLNEIGTESRTGPNRNLKRLWASKRGEKTGFLPSVKNRTIARKEIRKNRPWGDNERNSQKK